MFIYTHFTEQKSVIIAGVQQDKTDQNDEALIYLYFDVNPNYNIVRVLVIKNNLLADNPFNIVQFTTNSIAADEEDDDDFCFDMQDNDELSNLNLTDIQEVEPVQLSSYNKIILAFYALWAIQSAQIKQSYKNITAWLVSEDAK